MGTEFGCMSIIFKEEQHKYSPWQIMNIYQYDSNMCTIYIHLSTNICVYICESIWPYLVNKEFLEGLYSF